MTWHARITTWLETRWVNPAYSGWLLLCLAIFLFIAATNTLAGWLYVMSGAMLALLLVAAVLSYQNLQSLQVERLPTDPVTVGEPIRIALTLNNLTKTPKRLMQVVDHLPPTLSPLQPQTIELVLPQACEVVSYDCPTHQRGIYRWQNLTIRTAAPLGLFWRRQTWPVRTMAIVYPQILPISQCPLIDHVGREQSLQVLDNRQAQAANEGVTRSLRPYRWGDPMRMIHWSTSARHGELRVRELEIMTSGQELLIALDSAMPWHPALFEQAVTAATSLYFYAVKQQLNVSLWTAGSGRLQGEQQVLRVMAGVQPGEAPKADELPREPLIWLTPNIHSLDSLPTASRWLLWQPTDTVVFSTPPIAPGKVINNHQALGEQLQAPVG